MIQNDDKIQRVQQIARSAFDDSAAETRTRHALGWAFIVVLAAVMAAIIESPWAGLTALMLAALMNLGHNTYELVKVRRRLIDDISLLATMNDDATTQDSTR